MDVYNKEQYLEHREQLKLDVLSGHIFIYPTDTIYGIGCNALLPHAVNALRDIKGRSDKPFSVIVPSKDWVREHCIVTEKGEELLAKLPGPFTLIFKLNTNIIPDSVTNTGSLGIRIPDHPIAKIAEELDIPFVTTSVNLSGNDHLTSLDKVPEEIKSKVAFAIDEGELKNPPSTVVDLSKEKPVIIAR